MLIGSFVPQVAVDYLVDNIKDSLYLEKEESVPVYELLSVVAAQYNMTAENYCEVCTAPYFWKRFGIGFIIVFVFYPLFLKFWLFFVQLESTKISFSRVFFKVFFCIHTFRLAN